MFNWPAVLKPSRTVGHFHLRRASTHRPGCSASAARKDGGGGSAPNIQFKKASSTSSPCPPAARESRAATFRRLFLHCYCWWVTRFCVCLRGDIAVDREMNDHSWRFCKVDCEISLTCMCEMTLKVETIWHRDTAEILISHISTHLMIYLCDDSSPKRTWSVSYPDQ